MRLKLAVPLSSKDELLELVRQQGGVVEEQDLIGTASLAPGWAGRLSWGVAGARGAPRAPACLHGVCTGINLLDPCPLRTSCYLLPTAPAPSCRHPGPAGSQFCLVCLVEPGTFRSVHSFIQTSSGGMGRFEVLALAATGELDADVGAAAAGIEGLGLGPSGQQQQHQHQQPATQQPPPLGGHGAAASSSGFVAAAATTAPAPRPAANRAAAGAGGGTVVYARGPVEGLPEEHASRRERFAELDQLQQGWTVELRSRGEGDIIDALFFSPGGDCVGAYANARRMALRASKERAAA